MGRELLRFRCVLSGQKSLSVESTELVTVKVFQMEDAEKTLFGRGQEVRWKRSAATERPARSDMMFILQAIGIQLSSWVGATA